MTTLAWMLWSLFTVLAIGGCYLSSWVGDWVFAIGIGALLGVLAVIVHYVLT